LSVMAPKDECKGTDDNRTRIRENEETAAQGVAPETFSPNEQDRP
jgi:hypothetical protein